ncbi:hypothetical protein [Mycoplasma sp. 392]
MATRKINYANKIDSITPFSSLNESEIVKANDLNEIKQTVNEHADNIDTLTIQVNKISPLDNRITNLETANISNQQTIQDYRDNKNKWQQNLDKINTNTNKLNSLSSSVSDYSLTKSKVSALETKQNQQEQKINDNTQKINQLNVNGSAPRDYESVKSRLASVERTTSYYSSQTSSQNSKISAVESKVSRLETRFNPIENKANENERKVNEAKGKLEALETRHDNAWAHFDINIGNAFRRLAGWNPYEYETRDDDSDWIGGDDLTQGNSEMAQVYSRIATAETKITALEKKSTNSSAPNSYVNVNASSTSTASFIQTKSAKIMEKKITSTGQDGLTGSKDKFSLTLDNTTFENNKLQEENGKWWTQSFTVYLTFLKQLGNTNSTSNDGQTNSKTLRFDFPVMGSASNNQASVSGYSGWYPMKNTSHGYMQTVIVNIDNSSDPWLCQVYCTPTTRGDGFNINHTLYKLYNGAISKLPMDFNMEIWVNLIKTR